MNIEWQNHIINELIRENPDATVADFCELLADIRAIEKAAPTEKSELDKEINQAIAKVYETT